MNYAFTLSALSNSAIAGIIIGVVLGVIAVLALVMVVRANKNSDQSANLNTTTVPQNVAEPKQEEAGPEPRKNDEIDQINTELDEAAEELERLAAHLTVAEEEAVAETAEEAPVEEAIEEPVEAVEEAPVEEVVEEPVEAVEETPVEEVVEEPVEAVKEAPARVTAVRQTEDGKWIIRVRYNRSFTARVIQANDVLKDYYAQIKNEMLRYGVKSRISWRHETFRLGRKLLAKFTIRGKTLSVYYALNPADYEGTKYKVIDVSEIARNKAVPTLYKVKNDRRCRYAKQLIADLMKANGLEAGEEQNVDYAAEYPYEEIEPLIERKLVKLVPWKQLVTGSEVGEITVAEEEITEEIAAASELAAEKIVEEPEIIEEEVIEEEPEVIEEEAIEEEPEADEEEVIEEEPEVVEEEAVEEEPEAVEEEVIEEEPEAVEEEVIEEEPEAVEEEAVEEEPEAVEEEAVEEEPEVVEEIEVPTEEEIAEEFFSESEEQEEEQPEEILPEVEMSISVSEAEEILDDEFVESFVRQSNRYSDKSKKAIVNIDTLGRYFNKGETVTVDEIKKRVPGISKNVTYVKVLARGTLDKSLTVEADDFSPQAIKMIVLTGGTVVRTKANKN